MACYHMATNMIDVEPVKQSSVPKRGLTTMKHALKPLGAPRLLS